MAINSQQLEGVIGELFVKNFRQAGKGSLIYHHNVPVDSREFLQKIGEFNRVAMSCAEAGTVAGVGYPLLVLDYFAPPEAVAEQLTAIHNRLYPDKPRLRAWKQPLSYLLIREKEEKKDDGFEGYVHLYRIGDIASSPHMSRNYDDFRKEQTRQVILSPLPEMFRDVLKEYILQKSILQQEAQHGN